MCPIFKENDCEMKASKFLCKKGTPGWTQYHSTYLKSENPYDGILKSSTEPTSTCSSTMPNYRKTSCLRF